jgi:hypothetical protein
LRLPRPTTELVALACGLAAALAAAAGVLVSLRQENWNVAGLVRVHDTLPIAQLARRDNPHFPLRQESGFYDGAYFYATARDPLATGEAHRLVDEAPYRYGHPMYGWLSWLVSGGGQPAAVPGALLFVGLASILLAGVGASMLAVSLGWTAWGGLAVALNPGLVFAVNVDTTEPLGAALLMFGLVAQRAQRRVLTLTLFAALCFVKEPLVLVPLAIAAWELWRKRRLPSVGFAVVPAVLWWCYLRIHLGAFPFGQGSERLTVPLAGWKRGLLDAASQSWNDGVDTAQMGQASVALIIVVGLAILVAGIYALKLRSVVAPAFLAIALLYACITPNGVQYPKDLIRELALVLVLLPFVLVARGSPAEQPSGRKYPRARLPFRQRSRS